MMIPVTKPHLPNKENFFSYIDEIYKNGRLTNQGPLVQKLEERLKKHLRVDHLVLVSNGSIALQLAYKALGIQGEVITTPFSFCATSNTLAWEGIHPVFADIDPETFNLDPKKIEVLINENTAAILPVHVFGNPCEIENIEKVAKKYGLKTIYDAAHSFGVQYQGKSVLAYGDMSVLSFHATKLFHTAEGGAIITKNSEMENTVRMLLNFGINHEGQTSGTGINAKMNELEAAMGLAVLDEIEEVQIQKKINWEIYSTELAGWVTFQRQSTGSVLNHSYVPIVVPNEVLLKKIEIELNASGIFPRRYFYPSLDTIEYSKKNLACEQSRNLSSKILCLPTYTGLDEQVIIKTSKIIKTILNENPKPYGQSTSI